MVNLRAFWGCLLFCKESERTSSVSDDRDDAGQVDVTGCDSDDEDAVTSLRTSQIDPLRQLDPLRPGLPATTVPVLPSRPDEARSRTPSPNPVTPNITTPSRPRIWSLADVLGPTTTSVTSGVPTRTTSVTGAGLTYPMPVKPTASSALQGYCSPTASSLRHWSERSPYPIPVSLALTNPFGLSPARPNGLTGPERTLNGTVGHNGLPAFTSHPGLTTQYGLSNDRLRSHPSSSPGKLLSISRPNKS